jgi:serine/threonine protein kinase
MGYSVHGDYKIFWNRVLGHGYSSVVYEGFDITASERIAVKVISKSKNITKIRNLIENEIKFLKLLQNHDNVIKLLHYSEDTNNYYFFLELCTSNFDIMKITNQNIIYFMEQLIDILILLHDYNIIHNDIKPLNILIKNNKLKIIDFGMAEDNDIQSSYISGSPLYMNLEKFMGRKSFDSDLWSIKLIFFELVYKKHPFIKVSNKDELRTVLKQNTIIFPYNIYPYTDLLIDLFSNKINSLQEIKIKLHEIKNKESENICSKPITLINGMIKEDVKEIEEIAEPINIEQKIKQISLSTYIYQSDSISLKCSQDNIISKHDFSEEFVDFILI